MLAKYDQEVAESPVRDILAQLTTDKTGPLNFKSIKGVSYGDIIIRSKEMDAKGEEILIP